jgi:hypothetical protein
MKNAPKFTPYVLFGGGILRYTVSCISCTATTTRNGINAGGGVSWHTGDNWGIRPEAKVLVGNHSANRYTARYSFGIFYQFGR